MPFVKRDERGDIVSVSKIPQEGHEEELSNNDPGLIAFISNGFVADDPVNFLLQSDIELSRVLEDLINLMVNRGMINFTDLPESAQAKLLGRRKARAALKDDYNSAFLVDDEVLKL